MRRLDIPLSATAIQALELLGARAALPYLDRLTDRDPDERVRRMAFRAAAAIRAARWHRLTASKSARRLLLA